MNNTTLGNSASLFLRDHLIVICKLTSMIIRLPVNIYMVHVIISRGWITSEFYTLKKAIFELVICLQDTLGLFDLFFSNIYLTGMKHFFLGFTVVGRPYVLTLICVECYLATVKPVVFLRFKPLRYKLFLSGIVWFLTLVSCFGSAFVAFVFPPTSVVLVAMCCAVQIYCCVCTLLILKQPGPGEGIRQEQGMNSKKQKAFRTILVTTVSVILAYFPLMILIILNFFVEVKMLIVVLNLCYIFTFFSGFAHSFLFLQRSGKLPCITCP